MPENIEQNVFKNRNLLNLAGIIQSSRSNGPGSRAVIFFQGCKFNCPGCYNPQTHSFKRNEIISPVDLLIKLSESNPIEGITISGGEPFEQKEGLYELLKLSKEVYGYSNIVYTGNSKEEIEQKFFAYIDVLIEGRFEFEHPEKDYIRGSTNQRFHFFSNRYNKEDLKRNGDSEIIFLLDGSIMVTGFAKVEI
ncbi:MAG: radical SAM protein [Leptospiraceae bacterium]|nr:radical SAM protein [Leptospiraceae bacterium]